MKALLLGCLAFVSQTGLVVATVAPACTGSALNPMKWNSTEPIAGSTYGNENMLPGYWGPKFQGAYKLPDWQTHFRDVKLMSVQEPSTDATYTARYNSAIDAAYAANYGGSLGSKFVDDTRPLRLTIGLWASAIDSNPDPMGNNSWTKEFGAFKRLVAYTTDQTRMTNQETANWAKLILAISVGSEDLYRYSQPDQRAGGITAAILIQRIEQVRTHIAENVPNSFWAKVPIGHVDTFQIFVPDWDAKYSVPDPLNPGVVNSDIVCHLDWIGMNAFPFWQKNDTNTIDNAMNLYITAYNQVVANARGRRVVATETGWPTWFVGEDRAGATTGLGKYGQAMAGLEPSLRYYQQVYCGFLYAKKLDAFYFQFSEWPSPATGDIHWGITFNTADPAHDADNPARFNSTALFGSTFKKPLNCDDYNANPVWPKPA